MNAIHTFKRGVLLSLAPAILATVYKLCENNTLEDLFYLVPFLIFILLISAVVSYVTLRKILDGDAAYPATPGFVVGIYFVAMICIILGTVQVFIEFKVRSAYILLPVTMVIAGGLAFSLLDRFVVKDS